MLALTRKLDEEIVIDGGITVKIIGIKCGRVMLGIDAPPGVSIDRKEVHLRRLVQSNLPSGVARQNS